MTQGLHRTREGELFEDPERYRRLVEKLNYLTITHSNIAYSVSVVSYRRLVVKLNYLTITRLDIAYSVSVCKPIHVFSNS